MPEFHVDIYVAAHVEKLAKKQPFESLSFNDALRRILDLDTPKQTKELTLEDVGALPSRAGLEYVTRASSPSARSWAYSVPELKSEPGLVNWKAICDYLHIEVGADSARRRLKVWVEENRPSWPAIPEPK